MFTTANTKDWLEAHFASINLEALNAKAAMLERLDHKYVVDAGVLFEAIPHLLEHFDILEINHRRSF
ncbi:MAG: vacuolar transporter, partial [Rhodoferax sp.]|nr:vacuolar transporter [Rhodoferax sp.]